ncbi:MAG: DUF2071 domain-containing protein [Acidobacteria bacterium]|nr:DUF2071 domain-containing protein [Acidobacteriota bacterium]
MEPGRFLTAEWRYLAMINYEIDPVILAPFVPRGTELDQWRGKSFVSIVGFLFLKTQVLGFPIPYHRNFEEINLRFYVRRHSFEGRRRGVVFIKEIVPRSAIAAIARMVYNENYSARRMKHLIDLNGGNLTPEGSVEYGWREDERWNFVRARITGEPQQLIAGSEEEFITEHYYGYTAQRDGGSIEYRVEHPSWRVWQVSEAQFDCDVARVYGNPFVQSHFDKPTSAFVAEGSAITVHRGVKL